MGRKVLDLGLSWVVGNGATISVWKDSWIQGGENQSVQTDRGNLPENWRVKDLMLDSTSTWNAPLIRNYFSTDEANRILAMPTSRRREDVLAWGMEKDGIYSVRSGYKALMAEENRAYTVPRDELDKKWK